MFKRFLWTNRSPNAPTVGKRVETQERLNCLRDEIKEKRGQGGHRKGG